MDLSIIKVTCDFCQRELLDEVVQKDENCMCLCHECMDQIGSLPEEVRKDLEDHLMGNVL